MDHTLKLTKKNPNNHTWKHTLTRIHMPKNLSIPPSPPPLIDTRFPSTSHSIIMGSMVVSVVVVVLKEEEIVYDGIRVGVGPST